MTSWDAVFHLDHTAALVQRERREVSDPKSRSHNPGQPHEVESTISML